MLNNNEVWKDIQGYEGIYQISSLGQVKSLYRIVQGKPNQLMPIHERVLKQHDYKGYLKVKLSIGGRMKSYYTHILVARAFVPNLKGLPEVNHIDEIKHNNTPDNLEWCTRGYNVTYGSRLERASKSAKKRILQYDMMGNFIKEWDSAIDAERLDGFDATCICRCCKGEYTQHKGYKWRYAND